MNASLRNLLHGIVDYAGLFPPASLPLDAAVRNYADYQRQRDAWLLGRFICPAGRHAELEAPCQGLFSRIVPVPLSVLGTGGATAAEFLTSLDADLLAVRACLKQHGPQAHADVFEVRLPPEVVAHGVEAVAEFVGQVKAHFREYEFDELRPFYEVTLGPHWHDEMPAAIAGLRQFNETRTGRQPRAGLKLRCGGLEAAAFPSTAKVAACLRACITHRVPFKATAGLHHPIRRFDPALQTHMPGFINVFGGGVLAAVHDLDEKRLQEILEDEDPRHFQFTDEEFRWGDYRVSTADIWTQREHWFTSFGSCSFDEPRDDLKALGWL